MEILITLLAALSWMGIAWLVFFMYKIARFYERSSSENAFSWLFIFPLLLLPAGAGIYVIYDIQFVGITLGDALLFIGGALLILAALLLHQIMMGER